MQVLVRPPGSSFPQCALTFLERTPVDLDLARTQHAGLVEALRVRGHDVHSLPALDELPDSCFVEDPAVVLDDVAVIARPALASRRGERESLEQHLAMLRPLVHITAPGTLEGGDVLAVEETLYVGWSERTNHAGLKQLAHLLLEYGYRVKAVEVKGSLHLKTAVTRVADDLLLVNPAWVDLHRVQGMRLLEVDPSEPFAACALMLDGVVYYPENFPRTLERLEQTGLEVVTLPLSEFQKAEGGPTCLALIVS
jgi:dimethylargininase